MVLYRFANFVSSLLKTILWGMFPNVTRGNPLYGIFCRVTYPATFGEICNHDNDTDALLPNHAPVIVKGRRQGALRADVGARLVVALQKR